MSTIKRLWRRARAQWCGHDFNLVEAYRATPAFTELTGEGLVWHRRTVDGKFCCAKCGRVELIEDAITRQFVGRLDLE